MDLLATVRKEGSRGGRGDFKWTDVQSSSHRENYLGHSLMAPVGRWQKGRDLSWYAKADDDAGAESGEDPAAKAARERKEEIQRVKEAEEDALARALGLPVAPRNNPNLEELGGQREVGRVLKEAADDNDPAASRGVGYGRLAGMSGSNTGVSSTERIEGTANPEGKELQYALKEYKRRHGDRDHKERRHRKRSNSRSRDRSHKRDHRRRRRDGHRHDRNEEGRRGHRARARSFSNERSHSPSDSRRHETRRRSRSPRDRHSHHGERKRYDRR